MIWKSLFLRNFHLPAALLPFLLFLGGEKGPGHKAADLISGAHGYDFDLCGSEFFEGSDGILHPAVLGDQTAEPKNRFGEIPAFHHHVLQKELLASLAP